MTPEQIPTAAVSSHQALAIAEADAVTMYENLGRYRIEIELEPDGWHIAYRIKQRRWAGGGPWYVIDATTGAIVSKKYYQ
jgi:hypothetical protein